MILEALASGLPVVSTAISGIPLAVESGVEGILVPEQDRTALKDAIASLLANLPTAAPGWAPGARARAVSQLTWDQVAAAYRAAYLEALSERQRQ